MTVQLRPYQLELEADVYNAWAMGARNVVMRLGTGGGKTAILAHIVEQHEGASCVIAHRDSIVIQLSIMLARYGVRHRVIAAKETIQAIVQEHMEAFGRVYYDPGARCAVASIRTLVRAKGLAAWAAQVTLWIVDEGHHLVDGNEWHDGISLFTNPACRGLLPTATPGRADKQGLGRKELGGSGVADVMVEGPPERWLIDEGYLTDYKVYCPKSDMTIARAVAKSGDWSPAVLKESSENSHIVGDVVQHYYKWSYGLTAILFTTDVGTAEKMKAEFIAFGIRADVLVGTTDPRTRRRMLKALEAGDLDVVIAIDVVSEGFDLPAIVTGIMARMSQSFPVYSQQFGRFIRPMYAPGYDLSLTSGRLAAIANGPKPYARLIDPAGNFIRHMGGPDRQRIWTLADGDKRSNGPSDAIPLIRCDACEQPYERFRTCCPHCGAPLPEPASRSEPKFVDGDVFELDPDVLTALRGSYEWANRNTADMAQAWAFLPQPAILSNAKQHNAKLAARDRLREAMAAQGGRWLAEGLDDRAMMKRFFLTYGVDTFTAFTLDRADTEALIDRVNNHG